MILAILIAIGISAIAKPIYSIVFSIYQHYRKLNLKQVYGEGWAIVTGASDGIGFGFCQ